MSSLKWLTSRPVAHRGLHDAGAGIIENTRSAVIAALESGYAIEVDLQASADNKAMVFHDYSLERLTDTNRFLSELTEAELKQVKFNDTADQMMSLKDLLDLVQGRAPILLEIKNLEANIGPLEKEIVRVLKSYSGHVAVMSFNPKVVSQFRKLDPNLPRGIVSEDFRDDKKWGMLTRLQRFQLRNMLHWFRAKPDFVAYGIHSLPCVAPLVVRFLLWKPILTWTVRTRAEHQRARIFANNIIFENFRP
ncbi:MAG: glycerophosphodiester phosphodiesterase [Rhizobiales bacterium]|nr:glycerophosphodiester phosphodiesterase [Hyphomicrobiales bacterium]